MDTSVSSLKAIIILDENNKIIGHNDIALTISNQNILKDRPYHTVAKYFKNYKSEISNIDNLRIIIFHNDNTHFFTSILAGSLDEIFICDKNGNTLFCNDAFEKNYGIPVKNMIGKNVSYLVENGYTDRTFINEVIRTKKAITYEQKTKNNKIILNTTTPLLNDEGEIQFIIENCRDITEINNLKSNLYDVNETLNKYKDTLTTLTSDTKKNFSEFKTPQMLKIYDIIDKISNKNINVLILGESGTGKTQMANLIHSKSFRNNKPFVSINCSTIPETLLESELFGYEKGAFTGASSNGKIGLIEQANGGTLFLDEIGELPLSLQVKLLEFIQEKKFIPIGSSKAKIIDTRIIAATNQDLDKMIKEKKFRKDLYYRLAVAYFEIPPLRERKDDISLLLKFYMQYYNKKHQTSVKLSDEAYNLLLNYSWYGNIRELEHLIEFLVVSISGNLIEPAHLPQHILKSSNANITVQTDSYSDSLPMQNFENTSLDELVCSLEKQCITSLYTKYKSSYKVAEILKISQSKAHRLIKKYTIT